MIVRLVHFAGVQVSVEDRCTTREKEAKKSLNGEAHTLDSVCACACLYAYVRVRARARVRACPCLRE